MVEDHHKDLEAFIKEVNSTGYPDFKDSVSKGEKVVRMHLDMATRLRRRWA
jgi:hypothetical protein